jgi:outer membrane immunogenic protein
MKKLLLGTVALAALAAPAMAADMGVRPAPAAYVAGTNWAGIYFGANGGYTWGTCNTGFSANPPPSPLGDYFTFGQGSTPNIMNVDAVGSFARHCNGWTGGGQVGFNLQHGSWVGGFEADFDAFRPRASATAVGTYGPTAGSANNNFVFTDSWGGGSSNWLSTFRGRVGVAPGTGNALFYATLGLAVAKLNFTGSFNDFQTSPPRASGGLANFQNINSTQMGVTAGGGIEYAITHNLSVKAEYLYLHLAANGESFALPTNGFGAGTCTGFCSYFHWNPTFTEHMVRVGVNYRFGLAPFVLGVTK